MTMKHWAKCKGEKVFLMQLEAGVLFHFWCGRAQLCLARRHLVGQKFLTLANTHNALNRASCSHKGCFYLHITARYKTFKQTKSTSISEKGENEVTDSNRDSFISISGQHGNVCTETILQNQNLVNVLFLHTFSNEHFFYRFCVA